MCIRDSPTPEVEYHNMVAQPTEQQKVMVKDLSDRASAIHSGSVDLSQDCLLYTSSSLVLFPAGGGWRCAESPQASWSKLWSSSGRNTA